MQASKSQLQHTPGWDRMGWDVCPKFFHLILCSEPLGNHPCNTWFRQDHNGCIGRKVVRGRIFAPQLTHYLRRDKSTFTLKTSGSNHLRQGIKCVIPNNGTTRHDGPFDVIQGAEHNIAWVVYLSKRFNVNLITKRPSNIQIVGFLAKQAWALKKKVSVMKEKIKKGWGR